MPTRVHAKFVTMNAVLYYNYAMNFFISRSWRRINLQICFDIVVPRMFSGHFCQEEQYY